MAYFPMFLDLKEKNILVVGGGKIAFRRVKTLLNFDCTVYVLAPEMNRNMEELKKEEEEKTSGNGRLFLLKRTYEKNDPMFEKTDFFFVLAAATEVVNGQVTRDFKEKKIPVNNCSDRDACDFYFPGIAKEGETVVGITSGGQDHRFTAKLSSLIRQLLKETWKA